MTGHLRRAYNWLRVKFYHMPRRLRQMLAITIPFSLLFVAVGSLWDGDEDLPTPRSFRRASPCDSVDGAPLVLENFESGSSSTDERGYGLVVSDDYGRIDWETIGSQSKLSMVYVRVSQGRKADACFRHNWAHAHQMKVKRGVLHDIDFSLSGDQQAAFFLGQIGRDLRGLPPVLRIVEEGIETRVAAVEARTVYDAVTEVKRAIERDGTIDAKIWAPIVHTSTRAWARLVEAEPRLASTRLWPEGGGRLQVTTVAKPTTPDGATKTSTMTVTTFDPTVDMFESVDDEGDVSEDCFASEQAQTSGTMKLAQLKQDEPDTRFAIDVSHYQGPVDWKTVREEIDIAYVKATEGATLVDACFALHWSRMKQAKVQRGAYHYFNPRRPGKEQADNFLAVYTAAQYDASDLPPALDLEDGDAFKAAGGTRVLPEIQVWLDTVEKETKKKPIIYTGPNFWKRALSNDERFAGYGLWVVDIVTNGPKLPDPWDEYVMWQFTFAGEVDGVAGAVDIDRVREGLIPAK